MVIGPITPDFNPNDETFSFQVGKTRLAAQLSVTEHDQLAKFVLSSLVQHLCKILGVSPTASSSDVKRAYRDLVRQYQPDGRKGECEKKITEDRLKDVNHAYHRLKELMGWANFPALP